MCMSGDEWKKLHFQIQLCHYVIHSIDPHYSHLVYMGGGGGGGSTSFYLIRAAKKGKIGMR